MSKPEKFIDEKGLRLDGRRVDEIRPMKIEIGVLSRANGSCYLEWGRNKILVGVYGPREAHPRRTQRSDAAVIRYRYNMASFSVEDRARPGPSRRSIEISKVSREAFEPVIMAELYPKTAIDIFVEVLQADAGTRTAAINASAIALADAGIPMKGLVSACAFGKVDGQLVLDLNKEEDNYGEADCPVALTQDGEISLMQMDGNLTQEEVKRGLELIKKGCSEILEIQRKALMKKFSGFEEKEKAQAEKEIISPEAEKEVSPEKEQETEKAVEKATRLTEVPGFQEILETEEPVEETEEVTEEEIEAEEFPEAFEAVEETEEALETEALEEAMETIEEEAFETEEELEPWEADLEESFKAEKSSEEEISEEGAELEEEAFEPLEEEAPAEHIEAEEVSEIKAETAIKEAPEEVSETEKEEAAKEAPEEVSEIGKEEAAKEVPDEVSEIKAETAEVSGPVESAEVVEATELKAEEKPEGPWKVVKDPMDEAAEEQEKKKLDAGRK